jgi:hypothetical protein
MDITVLQQPVLSLGVQPVLHLEVSVYSSLCCPWPCLQHPELSLEVFVLCRTWKCIVYTILSCPGRDVSDLQ